MLKLWKKHMNENGFTLVEIMIVVIILGILSGIALVSFGGLDTQAKNARAQADLRAIATALKGYKAMTGDFPAAAPGLTTLATTAAPYTALIDSIPGDPWNPAAPPANIYQYDATGAPASVIIWSYGPNGANDTHAGDDIVMTVQ